MAEVSINRKLNFVIEVETSGGKTAYVHVTPILRETFKAYYDVIGRVYTQLFTGGGGDISGPRTAAFILEDHSRKLGVWEGPQGVKNGLMDEIRRLSNVVTLTDDGWKNLPYADAVRERVFDPDDFDEVDHILVFFIVVSAMAPKEMQRRHLEFVSNFLSVRAEPLDFTAFANGLKTLPETENTGEKAIPSSIPH